MAHKPQRCSKLIDGKSSAQPSVAVVELRAAGRVTEGDQRLAESAQWTREWFDGSRLPRWTAAVLVELIGTQIGWWIETAAEAFERVCPAEITGARRERLKALNVWVSIGYCWYVLCPAYNAPVRLFLYEFLSACGLPLSRTYKAADRTRKRLQAQVRAIIDGTSRLGEARRLRVLLCNPCILGVMLELGPLPCHPNQRSTTRSAAPVSTK
jgi:hypothetical protein